MKASHLYGWPLACQLSDFNTSQCYISHTNIRMPKFLKSAAFILKHWIDNIKFVQQQKVCFLNTRYLSEQTRFVLILKSQCFGRGNETSLLNETDNVNMLSTFFYQFISKIIFVLSPQLLLFQNFLMTKMNLLVLQLNPAQMVQRNIYFYITFSDSDSPNYTRLVNRLL